MPMAALANLGARLHVRMGIITVPASAAQRVAEAMVAAGIHVIWHYAPCRLALPDAVLVENEDLAAELATPSHHITLPNHLLTTNASSVSNRCRSTRHGRPASRARIRAS
jgi:NADH/NAD ratio-sensing transcriptional regulator Rex